MLSKKNRTIKIYFYNLVIKILIIRNLLFSKKYLFRNFIIVDNLALIEIIK